MSLTTPQAPSTISWPLEPQHCWPDFHSNVPPTDARIGIEPLPARLDDFSEFIVFLSKIRVAG